MKLRTSVFKISLLIFFKLTMNKKTNLHTWQKFEVQKNYRFAQKFTLHVHYLKKMVPTVLGYLK